MESGKAKPYDNYFLSDGQLGRCVNFDWIELYCLENFKRFPCNAEYYRSRGWSVKVRDYGTRQYKEMFTLFDNFGEPFLEFRRNPVASDNPTDNKGIFDPQSCHIRVSNRYCYHTDIIDILTNFLQQNEYEIKHIYRLDICLDFTKFDSGDDPSRFLRRYMEGKYSKINQGNVSAYGKDLWNGRHWNSLSWGAPTSMVSTKFYCKSMELAERKDKPYIRLAWRAAGLIDNPDTLVKVVNGEEQTQTIWRVEFSIRAKARQWLIIEDCNGAKTKRVAMQHALGSYRTPHQLMDAFIMLQYHYFHFKYYVEGKRKDRCPDKVLFNFALDHTIYKLDVLGTATTKDATENALLRKLRQYRITCSDDECRAACDTLIHDLEQHAVQQLLPQQLTSESFLLQALIERRFKQNPKEPMNVTLDKVNPYLNLFNELY